MRFTYQERIRRLIDLPERDRWHLALGSAAQVRPEVTTAPLHGRGAFRTVLSQDSRRKRLHATCFPSSLSS
jgi:hypothetical protein